MGGGAHVDEQFEREIIKKRHFRIAQLAVSYHPQDDAPRFTKKDYHTTLTASDDGNKFQLTVMDTIPFVSLRFLGAMYSKQTHYPWQTRTCFEQRSDRSLQGKF